MTIVLLTDGLFPFTLGGIQKHSYYLAKYWAKQGLQVHVYHPNQYNEADLEQHFSKEELQNISFIHVPHPSSVRFFGHYIYNSYRYSKRLYQAIGQKPYDGIYAQGFTGWYFLKKEPFNERVVTNLHGLEMYQAAINAKTKLQHYLLRLAAGPIIKQSYKQISLGGQLTDILYRQGAITGSVYEVPNAISPEWLYQTDSVQHPEGIDDTEKANVRENISNNAKRSDDAFRSENIRRFIFIGRYERRKGIEEINIVLQQLLADKQPFECHFIGPIPQSKQIAHQLINSSTHQLKYHGSISNQHTIQQLLMESDILLCPSYSEGMPTVILEAMACHCAIIATDVGASGELVDQDNGWLIQGDIVSGLKNAMQEALEVDATCLDQMKDKSLQRVKEKFTWDVVARQSIEVFNQ